MRKIFAVTAAVLCAAALSAACAFAGNVTPDGYCSGIKLCGRVKVVEHFPDLRVQVVSSFPDLRVKKVSHFPDAIGEWQFVEHGEDFTVQFVDHFPDLTIEYVDAFPGVD